MMPSSPQNTSSVLILDANQRSALAATRSLGRKDGVLVSTADSTISALAGSSRYSTNYYQSPCPKTNPTAFIDWLSDVTNKQSFDIIFPMTEISSQLLLMHQDRLPKTCKIPFADYKTIMQLADKCQLMQLASTLGITHPQTAYYDNAAQLDAAEVTQFPTVIKPGLSRVWADNHWIETAVTIPQDSTELSKQLNKDYLKSHPFMLQQFIPGHGAGVFALYDHGKPVTFFAHQRLREKPPRGGVSVLSQSAELDKQLLTITCKLLDSVQWHGVAMVEFRIAPDGTPYLMEVNTRFWGSLQLAIDAGVDFPALLLAITMGEPVYPPPSYNKTQLRWLLGDLDSLYLYLKDPGFSPLQKLRRIAQFLWPSLHTRHEVNRWSDLKPAWFELKQYLAALRH